MTSEEKDPFDGLDLFQMTEDEAKQENIRDLLQIRYKLNDQNEIDFVFRIEEAINHFTRTQKLELCHLLGKFVGYIALISESKDKLQ